MQNHLLTGPALLLSTAAWLLNCSCQPGWYARHLTFLSRPAQRGEEIVVLMFGSFAEWI